jgi:hypothetical protein
MLDMDTRTAVSSQTVVDTAMAFGPLGPWKGSRSPGQRQYGHGRGRFGPDLNVCGYASPELENVDGNLEAMTSRGKLIRRWCATEKKTNARFIFIHDRNTYMR